MGNRLYKLGKDKPEARPCTTLLAKWTVIDCGLWQEGGELQGKIVSVDDYVCNGDKSCTCTESWKRCWYCDPEGLERNRTNIFDSAGEPVAYDNGCDCREYCKEGFVGHATRTPRVLKETICVENPYH